MNAPERLWHGTHGERSGPHPTPASRLLPCCPRPVARQDAEAGDGGHRWGKWPTMGRGAVLGPLRPRRRAVAAHSVPMEQMYLHRASVAGTPTAELASPLGAGGGRAGGAGGAAARLAGDGAGRLGEGTTGRSPAPSTLPRGPGAPSSPQCSAHTQASPDVWVERPQEQELMESGSAVDSVRHVQLTDDVLTRTRTNSFLICVRRWRRPIPRRLTTRPGPGPAVALSRRFRWAPRSLESLAAVAPSAG